MLRGSIFPILIGPVIQISDGEMQTSGVTVKVKPYGQAAAAGEGTVSYVDGVVEYTPTAAETDHVSFGLTAAKSGCITASQNIFTSASSEAGRVALETDALNAAALAGSAVNELAVGIRAELAAELAKILELPTKAEVDAGDLDSALEGAISVREGLRIFLSALVNLNTGVGTDTESYKSADGSKNRIVVVFDPAGNRTSVTLDGT